MRKSCTFKGVKIEYTLQGQDGLQFADVLEVSRDGAVLDMSTHDIERIKKMIYTGLPFDQLVLLERGIL